MIDARSGVAGNVIVFDAEGNDITAVVQSFDPSTWRAYGFKRGPDGRVMIDGEELVEQIWDGVRVEWKGAAPRWPEAHELMVPLEAVPKRFAWLRNSAVPARRSE